MREARALSMTLDMLPSVSVETKTLDRTFLRCDLPTANAVLSEFKKEMLAVVAAMCSRTKFECLLDGVVAAIYPGLLRPLVAFYAGRGPCLRSIVDASTLEELDTKIARRIRACALIAVQVGLKQPDRLASAISAAIKVAGG
jgi:hypothetical protein